MSMTHHKEQAEEARRALGQLSSAVRKRHDELDGKIGGFKTEEDNVLTGTRAALRAIDDDRKVVVEELMQHREVLGIQPNPEPEPTPAVDEGNEVEQTPPTQTVEQVSEPTPAVDEGNEVEQTPSPTTRRYHVADSMVGAVLAVLAGLFLFALLWGWATNDWILEMPTLAWGILKAVLASIVVYVVALAAGALGDTIEDRRQSND